MFLDLSICQDACVSGPEFMLRYYIVCFVESRGYTKWVLNYIYIYGVSSEGIAAAYLYAKLFDI